MNNDSTPTDLPRSENRIAPSEAGPAADSVESTHGGQDEQSPAQKRAQVQMKKKFEFVTSLTNNLDILIYAELSILYYMDCSLFRLLLRVLNQMMFLTPKPNFIPPAPQHRPYIGAIFGPNIICILLHIFTARSEAGEAMRGYLHGGVIVDLIGQKGPTSKMHLVLLDLLILGLQCFMLAVHVEKERLSALLAAYLLPAASSTDQARVAVVSSQDHDAEERGIMRDGITSNGDIELQPLAPRNDEHSILETEGQERNEEHERLLAEPAPRQDDEDDYPSDTFWSGTAIVADFHVLHNLRRQWEDYGNATESAMQTVGFSAEFAAVAANRRLNAASARFQQNLNV